MEYIKIKDMKQDQKTSTVVLLTAIEEKETKGGSPYCRLTLCDGETQIQANLWNKTKADVKVPEKTLITVELYPKLYQEALSYEVFRYGPAPEDCAMTDYIVKAPYDSQSMYDNILAVLRKEIPDHEQDLICMVEKLYEDHKEKLLYWSAAKSVHHNCYGGLLYHTFRMIRSGIALSRVYQIDKELLLAGIALHDIGKIYELETDNLGTAEYSIDGVLFGHAMLGIELINKEVGRAQMLGTPYDKEKVRLLKHMLCAHHGNLDWGAITVPVIPEAMMLHEIDMIDSRIYQFEQVMKELEPGSISDKIFSLGSRVYKPLEDDKDE